MPYLYLSAAILFEIIGTIALKWSATTADQWTRPSRLSPIASLFSFSGWP